MKHRSVIAYVIVAAALFSLPQLSHELQSLKGSVGSHLHRELLHAVLSLPAGGASAAPAASANTLLASCSTRKSGGARTDSKAGSKGRAEGRPTEKSFEQRAMIGDPNNDPINNVASAGVSRAAETVSEVRVETEVAMIIPPGSGIDPRALLNTLKAGDVARVEADARLQEVEGLRVAYAAAARSGGQSPEWQKATEDAFRKFNAARPGGYEFRVVRDGKQTKVLKLKCSDCPAPAPRLTRLPRQVAVSMPLPAPVAPAAPFETAGE